jgi:hypothetical protein
MSETRDEFPKTVVEALSKRAAFICSNPDCRALTIAPSEADATKWIYIGKAAHICAAAERGPRYKGEMTPEERASASNGLFLCSSCADMIDKNNGLDFPEPVLRRWKEEHEKWVAANLNKRQSPASQLPTFQVTSVGQQGGITAGAIGSVVVTQNTQKRRIVDEKVKVWLRQLIPRGQRVQIYTPMFASDIETGQFATAIHDYLVSEGHPVALGSTSSIFQDLRVDTAVSPIVLYVGPKSLG